MTRISGAFGNGVRVKRFVLLSPKSRSYFEENRQSNRMGLK